MTEQISNISRRREVSGILSFASALFLALCLVSYSPGDPSFTHFVAGGEPIHNLIGSIGSYAADSVIRLIGLSSCWLPIILFVAAWKYFTDPSFEIGLLGFAGLTGTIFSTSGLASEVIIDFPFYGQRLRAGGLLGAVSAEFLNVYLSYTGTYLLLVVILILSLMIMIDISVISVGRKMTAFAGRRGIAWNGIARGAAMIRNFRKDSSTQSPSRNVPVIDGANDLQGIAQRRRKEKQASFDFQTPDGSFTVPPLTLLNQVERKDTRMKRESLIANSRILEKKLSDFGVEAKVVEVKAGPAITTYEVEPAPGVKINKITNLSDDLALALKAPSIRIIAPIPGKAVIGIEIPNHEREPVNLRDVLDNEAFLESQIKLPIALGEDIVGAPVITDLIRMPHLLIAGTTGSGKSVGLNAMICSILFKAPPDEVKFILIDPKRLELSAYEGIPHLLHPVVVDPKKAAQVLKWAVEEMGRRYEIIGQTGVKSIEAYNDLIGRSSHVARKAFQEVKEDSAGGDDSGAGRSYMHRSGIADSDEGKDPGANRQIFGRLPYIVIVIDELADLMLVAQRNVEESLARLAQMARAAGIHLILATQRPSVDVITGVIKANFPTRISFQVSSKVDSRTILDQLGAEKLLGVGDMLFIPPGTSKLTRIHGAYVTENEIERIVNFVRQQGNPSYDKSIEVYELDSAEGDKSTDDFDEKYDEAVELVTELGHASISLVQRYLKIGYNRAARIIEQMEAEGVVGPSDGVKPRKVLARKIPR
jgi:S-DNA-T family DNA segregation ATPase FtsK/SpoIIIE